MSTPSFKNLTQDDFTATTTMLNERIPLTGTLISGSARYGTSSADGRALNIKSFAHNMFQSVYDYPHLSSSANHIFDITAGFSANTGQSVSASATTDVAKKVNIYNQMAQVLVGYDVSGNVRRFDPDGNFSNNSVKLENAVFLNFSRLLVKDEIKKGSFNLSIGIGEQYATPFSSKVTVSDVGSAVNYRNNSPAGEYGFLKYVAQGASATLTINTNKASMSSDSRFDITDAAGVTKSFIFKTAENTVDGTTNASGRFKIGVAAEQAGLNDAAANTRQTAANAVAAKIVTVISTAAVQGVIGITATATNNVVTITQKTTGPTGNNAGGNGNFTETADANGKLAIVNFAGGMSGDTVGLIYYQAGIAALTSSFFGKDAQVLNGAGKKHDNVLKTSNISSLADGVRHRINNITFDNVTELNSSIYFCRINHNDFNYSSNPTYLSESKIVVKTNPSVANEAGLSPITYITTVGLYSTNNELMAVAKLSEPLKKTPDNEFTLRVRLDY